MRAPKPSDSPSGAYRDIYPDRDRIRRREDRERQRDRDLAYRRLSAVFPVSEVVEDPTGFGGEGCVL